MRFQKTFVFIYIIMMQYNNCFINISNLKQNATTIKNKIGKNTKLCAVVKANAYGHGIKPVCMALYGLADFFGVATYLEAKEIREFDTTTPIIVLGLTDIYGIGWCAEHNVSVTINSLQEVNDINKLALKSPVKIHFKVNTGLNRFGFSSISEFKYAYEVANQSKNIIIEGIFTHFATKAGDTLFVEEQHQQFLKFLQTINTQNLILHCCNSFACENYPQFYHQMVRCGFSLYGWAQGMLPVQKITSKVLAIQHVKAGQTVGYDRTYKPKKDCILAVVSLGYADGFDRKNSNKTRVVINNRWAKVVGLVYMDVCMVDITHIKNVHVGNTVLILGAQNNKVLSPQYYAKYLKTSPYEILLKFNHRRMNVICVE